MSQAIMYDIRLHRFFKNLNFQPVMYNNSPSPCENETTKVFPDGQIVIYEFQDDHLVEYSLIDASDSNLSISFSVDKGTGLCTEITADLPDEKDCAWYKVDQWVPEQAKPADTFYLQFLTDLSGMPFLTMDSFKEILQQTFRAITAEKARLWEIQNNGRKPTLPFVP